MIDRSDLVLAAIPALALAGPVAAAGARVLESLVGVGEAVAVLPLTTAGLVAAVLPVLGVTVWAPAVVGLDA